MLRKFLGLTMATVLIGTLLVLGASAPASAQKVDGAPLAVSFIFQSGEIKIGDEVAQAASGDDPITASGTLQPDGTLRFTNLSFPDIEVENTSGVGPNPIIVQVLPQQIPGQPAGTVGIGTLNPLNGVATSHFRIAVKINGFSDDCYIGSPGNPILLNLTTETSGSQTGVRYNTGTGQLTIVDGIFAVPGASGCEYAFVSVNGQINDELGLPSPSGNNYARLTAGTTPVVQAAIRPSFTATPSSGFAPLDVDFDASATYSARPVTSYQWDLDANGTFESTGITVSTTYATPGTRIVRLRVTDNQNDVAETTRQVVVNVPFPDLTITKDDGGSSFVTGTEGSYAIGVSNVGSAPTTGTITVTDTLPAGLTFVSGTGTGWSCGAFGQDVTCTHAGPLAHGNSLDDITLTVGADGSVIGPISNTATVSTAGDLTAANDSATDTGQIIQAGIDLVIDKTHDLDDGIFLGEQVTYRINVSNDGTLPATGIVVVTDTLPPGFDFNSVSGGLSWICDHDAGVISCFTNDDVPAGTSLSTITVIGVVDVETAPAVLSNTASVDVDGDANTANNSDTDTGDVLTRTTDLAVTKAHIGDFVVGEPAFYTIGVENVGNHASGGDVVVRDTLPFGMAYDGAAGDGWTCGLDPDDSGVVECTHDGGVEAGDELPMITLKVTVSADALPGEGSAVNVVDLTSGNDGNADNDHFEDPTVVRMPEPDLTISKTHAGNFVDGANGTYTITVSNVAEERADGPTVVTDTLPVGLTYVSATGSGWACEAVDQVVGCQYDGIIAGQSSAPPISIVVTAGSPAVVTNTATVSNALDDNAANDTATDPTRIDARPQAVTTLVAEAIVLRVDATGARLLAGAEARLTADGAPLPGKSIRFHTLSGIPLCDAITDANGVARCTPEVPTLLTAALNLRYIAFFTGDVDYTPASDEGALIRLGSSFRLL